MLKTGSVGSEVVGPNPKNPNKASVKYGIALMLKEKWLGSNRKKGMG